MLNNCMEISIKKADSLYLFDIMGALADVEIKRGNPAKALTILAPLDDPNKWSQINYNRFKLTQVDAYQSLGELSKAIQIALSQCKQMAGPGLRTERLSWLYRLYCLYSDAGDYRLAFKYVVQHQELKDTLLNLNQSEQITLAEKKYQVSQKQAENDLLNYELRTQKQYQLFGGIIVGLIILSGAVIVFAANWQRSLVTAKAQRLGAELQLSQMELANQQQASEVARLKEEALQQEQALLEESLERSRKELASKTAFMIRKNQLLTAIKEQADAANRLPKHLRDLIDKLDGILDEEDDWNSFKRHFEEVHPDFFSRLLALSPALTPNDLRILAYHKMKLSTKEMAYMTSVAEGSIRNIRLRIRKKLNIGDLDLGIWVEGV
jgi:DNA-binding CsgD family transcriptional regulator